MTTPTTRYRILLADDEPENRGILKACLESTREMTVVAVSDGEKAVEEFRAKGADLVVLDLYMPNLDGLDALSRIRELSSTVPVLILTAHSDVRTAVTAIQRGAYDFIAKPVPPDELLITVRRALDHARLLDEVVQLRRRGSAGTPFRELTGTSPCMRELTSLIEGIAPTGLAVLVTGETGVGKELVVRALHQSSDRSGRPLVAVDCGALPAELMEAELFGHEKGAYSGADAAREGILRLANGGTLFLDEVGNLPLALQPKLLRALQEKSVRPIGGRRELPVDVRVVAATNSGIEAQMATGAFRSDLYYRLAEYVLRVPPLRERREDIPAMVQKFLDEAAFELRRPVLEVDPAAVARLQDHDWPGNVRQLRNLIRAAVVGERRPRLDMASVVALLGNTGSGAVHVAETVALANGPAPAPAPSTPALPVGMGLAQISARAAESAEKMAINEALTLAGGNKAAAARRLAIDYKTLYRKLHLYGMS